MKKIPSGLNISFLCASLLALGFSLVSCGVNYSGTMIEAERKPLTFGIPRFFERQDPDCTASGARGFLSSETLVWFADKTGKIKQQKVDLSEFSMDGLKSSFIEDTVYSLVEFEINESEISQWQSSLEGRKYDLSEKKLYFCRPAGGYRRDSIENVALAALTGLQTVQKTYDNHSGHPPLKKIKLFVHPRVYYVQYDGSKRYSVDNAAFLHTDKLSWKDYVLAWPHSEAWEQKNSLNLWESPGVYAHELGHHIFNTLAPGANKIEEFANNRISGGLNEAFADLVSWYSLGIEGRYFRKLYLGDFTFSDKDSSRSLSNPVVVVSENGHEVEKVISEEFVENITTSEMSNELHPYREVHDTGSVFAYVFNRLLESRGMNDATSRTSYKLTLKWLEEFNRQKPWEKHKNNPGAFLRVAMKTMVEVARDADTGALDLSRPENSDRFSDTVKKLIPYYDFSAEI